MLNKNDQSAAAANDLRERVRAEIESAGITQRQASKEAGIDREGSSKLNQWLKGSYSGNNQEIEERLERWLATRAEQRLIQSIDLPQAPDWVETPTAARIHATLRYAQMSGISACIYGGAGVGKTLTCEHYRQTHNNVWIVPVSPAARSYAKLLGRIAKAVDLRGAPTKADDLEEALITHLRGTRGLLILDEAQTLDSGALWGVKHLFDLLKIGVVYVGSQQVYVNLTGGRRAEANAPLFRRISKRQSLGKPTARDVAILMSAWGLTGKKEIERAEGIANEPGALGLLTEVLRLASFLALGKGEALGAEHIAGAYRDLVGSDSKISTKQEKH